MNCLFCPQEIEKYKLPKYHCTLCNAVYVFDEHNQLEYYYFGGDYKEQTYAVVCRLKPTPIFYLIDKNSDDIQQLNYIPNVTPHNITKKIPTLLVFS